MSDRASALAKPAILLVDDDPVYRTIYQRVLRTLDLDLVIAASGAEALEQVKKGNFAAILLDVSLGDMDGFEVARQVRAAEQTRHTPVLFLTAHRTDDMDIDSGYAMGAVDYLFKPFRPAALVAKVGFFVELQRKSKDLENQVRARTAELTRAVEQLSQEVGEREAGQKRLQQALSEIAHLKEQLEAENVVLREEIRSASPHHQILGQSAAIQRVLNAASQVAATDSTVLILGETGSGKELLARAIHEMSGRKSRAMVMVNCAALPANLIESELFGHEKGAFTGAHASMAGRFEAADGSTLFLDEIGELPLELQSKLLRVLQEGQFERIGSTRTIKVNVRVIAATNRDLGRAVRENRFREDLYYRLNVFPITVPPLRDRLSDIPPLVHAFVQEFTTRMGKRIQSIPRRSMELLLNYHWPGNVRELRNVIERAMITSPGPHLVVEPPQAAPTAPAERPLQPLTTVERDYIQSVLHRTGWRIRGKNGAAAILEIKPTTLEARMAKLGIKRNERLLES